MTYTLGDAKFCSSTMQINKGFPSQMRKKIISTWPCASNHIWEGDVLGVSVLLLQLYMNAKLVNIQEADSHIGGTFRTCPASTPYSL